MIFSLLFFLGIVMLCLKRPIYVDRPFGKQCYNVFSLRWVCVLVALFYGLRYNYGSDYEAYRTAFKSFSADNYYYDALVDHVEIGWFYLNKSFSFLGYFMFVFICSCVFAYGNFIFTKEFEMAPTLLMIVLLGFYSKDTTMVLCSAQRQFLVTGIFWIAFSKFLLHENIESWAKLFSRNVLFYCAIIIACTLIHSSAIFLIVVPLLYMVPSGSIKTQLVVLTIIILFVLLGDKYLPMFTMEFTESLGKYDYLDMSNNEMGNRTVISMIMFSFQILFTLVALKSKYLTQDESVILLLSIIGIAINLTGTYLPQVYRLAMYIHFFTFLSIPIIYNHISKLFGAIFLSGMWIWILWAVIKVFNVSSEHEIYKTIFTELLG